MSQAAGQWPDSLKTWVTKTFEQADDSNRPAVEAEMKKKIQDAYYTKTLWTTNWAEEKLESLKPSNKRKKSSIAHIPSAHLSAAQAGVSGSKSFGDPDAASKDELDLRQKRQRRFENATMSGPAVPMAVLKAQNKKNGKERALTGGIGGLSLREQRQMSGTPDPVFNPDVIEWDEQTIVGTSRALEKPYLRLTSAPDPREVRPVAVLKQTLEHLKRKWRAENNYAWVCDQFKSLRQDLTVQRIKNDFTVMVYEIHARIALEKGDLGEYNQCQSQLRELYKHGLQGHPMEFLAYRILYLVHTRNRSDFNSLLASLTSEQREDENVQHALAVRSAIATSNYHRFFKLFVDAPKMGPYMMDHFVDRERVTALVTMTKAYMRLPLSYITDELAFDDSAAAHAFLTKWRAALYVPEPPAPSIHSKPISISLSAPKVAKPFNPVVQQQNGDHANGQQPEEKRILDCKAAQPFMLAASQTFQKVDIKGQI